MHNKNNDAKWGETEKSWKKEMKRNDQKENDYQKHDIKWKDKKKKRKKKFPAPNSNILI